MSEWVSEWVSQWVSESGRQAGKSASEGENIIALAAIKIIHNDNAVHFEIKARKNDYTQMMDRILSFIHGPTATAGYLNRRLS